MKFEIEIDRECDGRWIAELPELPGVLAYGETAEQARTRVQALVLRVVAERSERGEVGPGLLELEFSLPPPT